MPFIFGRCQLAFIFLVFLLPWLVKASVPATTIFRAMIKDPTNMPLEAASVNFRMIYTDPLLGSCVIYIEDFPAVDMTNSKGIVNLNLGTGSRAFPVAAYPYTNVYDNSLTSLNCQNGSAYSPAATANRKVVMQFNDGSGWQTLPPVSVSSVPFAMFAETAQTAKSVVGMPTCVGSQVLTFNGTSFTCTAAGTGTVLSVSASALPIVIGGSATAPTVGINQASATVAGYLSSGDWNAFNSKMANSLASGRVWIGNGSSLPTAVVVSGDATLADTGLLTLSNSGVSAGSGYSKISVDSKGRVTSAGSITSADITALGFSTSTALSLSLIDGLIFVGNPSNVATGVVLSGDAGISNTGILTLKNTGVVAGSSYTKFDVDSKGRVTAAGSITSADIVALGFATSASSSQWITSGASVWYANSVGIGTSAAAYALNVSGDVNVTGIFRVNGSPLSNVTSSSIFSVLATSLSGDGRIDVNGNLTLQNQSTTRLNLGLGTAAVYPINILGNALSMEVVRGDDLKLFDARAPIGAAGGDLSGAYPSPILSNTGVSAGTYTKVDVDAKGRVTSASQITALDITSLGFVSSQWTTSGANIYFNTGRVGVGTTPSTAGLQVSGDINLNKNLILPSTTSSSAGNLVIGSSKVLHLYGTGNIFIGQDSGNYTMSAVGMYNVAVGASTMSQNLSGTQNVAVGMNALSSNSSGDSNTAVGFNSQISNYNNGRQNTSLGAYSLSWSLAGATSTGITANTAIGAFALRGNVVTTNNLGIRNTALGHRALTAVTTGSGNLGLGANAGSSITTGNDNVVIGSNTGSSIATSDSNIILSDGLGNIRMQVNSTGAFGIGTTPTAYAMTVSGDLNVTGALRVNGAAVNNAAYNNSASLTFNFVNGQKQYTSASCGSVTLQNMVDGGSYQIAIQGTVQGTCVFTHGGDAIVFSPVNGPTVSGTETLYNFVKMGGKIYVTWFTGYQ